MTTQDLMIKLTKAELDELFIQAEGDIDFLYWSMTRHWRETSYTDTKVE